MVLYVLFNLLIVNWIRSKSEISFWIAAKESAVILINFKYLLIDWFLYLRKLVKIRFNFIVLVKLEVLNLLIKIRLNLKRMNQFIYFIKKLWGNCSK